MIDLISNNAVSFVTIVIFVLAAAVAKVAYREGYKRGQADLWEKLRHAWPGITQAQKDQAIRELASKIDAMKTQKPAG